MAPNLHLSVDRQADVPLGAQLASRIRSAMRDGTLAPGDRLPSVRDIAESAAVNVNTVRAVYARLEAEGVVRREHGRGTFVAGPRGRVESRSLSRQELRDQITALEATLARLPPAPLPADGESRRPTAPALLSTEELLDVRDRLVQRLEQLDTERTALLESLEQLGVGAPAGAGDPDTAASRRATPSLAGARIRWVGA